MRTNIVIDDQLMADALRLTGIRTKRQVVEAALQLMIDLERQQRIRRYRGKLQWEGNLDQLRQAR